MHSKTAEHIYVPRCGSTRRHAQAAVRLREESDLGDPAALDGVHDAPDRLVARLLVGAQMLTAFGRSILTDWRII
jgi:hypothetical protein